MNRFSFISGESQLPEEDSFKPMMLFGARDGDYYVTIRLKEKLVEGWLCGVKRRHKDAPRPSVSDIRARRNIPPYIDEIIPVSEIGDKYKRMMKREGDTRVPWDGIE